MKKTIVTKSGKLEHNFISCDNFNSDLSTGNQPCQPLVPRARQLGSKLVKPMVGNSRPIDLLEGAACFRQTLPETVP